jgi:Skp family chaperone for outer membrane proteins
MEIRVIDFEELTKHYVNYQNGLKEIQEEKDNFLKRVQPLKNEMESIIKMASSGLVVDNSTQESRMARFQQLQQEAMGIDSEFQSKMKEMRGKLNERSYDELEVIISEWAIKNSIDLVSGKMEIVFTNPKYESTKEILEVLKEKGLYVEHKEEQNEKESV